MMIFIPSERVSGVAMPAEIRFGQNDKMAFIRHTEAVTAGTISSRTCSTGNGQKELRPRHAIAGRDAYHPASGVFRGDGSHKPEC